MAFSRGGLRPSIIKENLNGAKGFFFICCMFCMDPFDSLTGKQEILVRIFVVYLSLGSTGQRFLLNPKEIFR